MDSPTINLLVEKISGLLKRKSDKEKEVQKRIEVLKTYSQSDSNKRKQDNKLNRVYNKIQDLSGSTVDTIHYYKNQIDKAEIIYERELKKLEAKKEEAHRKADAIAEEAKRKADAAFQINKDALEEKKDNNIKEYEEHIIRKSEKLVDNARALIEQTNTVVDNETIDEDGDKTLIKLKTELKQIQESYDECNDCYIKEVQKNIRYSQNKAIEKEREYNLELQEANNRKLEIAQQIRQQEREAEEQYKKKIEEKKITNPEEFLTKDEKKEYNKKRNTKIKEFKSKYSNIINNYKVDEELIFDNLLKHHLDTVVDFQLESDIISFFDTNKEFYKKKIQFEYNIDRILTETEVNIYNHLRELTKDEDIYYTFYDKEGTIKKKSFLKKYLKEYNHYYKEDN